MICRITLIGIWLTLVAPVAAQTSAWVQTGSTGRLIYTPDAEGDRVLDFSDVGYRGRGTTAIPNDVPTVLTVSPVAGDDTASIQAAIDQVAAMPIGADGYRGAVLLTSGTYDIHTQIDIRASGIVLRGAGRNTGGTILHGRNVGAEGTNQRPLVRVFGTGNLSNGSSLGNMIDKVVPVGSRSFRVNTTSGFAVGDTVRIERPSTQAWIDAIGMNTPLNGDDPWQPGTMNIRYDRVIKRIEGDRIFVDAPLANSFELQYGGGTIRNYSWAGAIENIGIENLKGDTDFDSPTDEDHAWEFIWIGGTSQTSSRAQNVWVRNIGAEHFGDSVVVANPSAKWVTVDDAVSTNPVSQITGGRRYTYDLSGDLGLVTNASADEGRHDFINNSTRPRGPNVFHNSTATNANSDTGPHQRWASGTLFDNITVEGDAINARNRGSFGTRHGWSGANMVIWNSTADSYRVQNPPTAQNWLIGSTGTIVEDTTFGPQPPGNYDSHGTPVTVGGTTSLYEAQMNDAADIRVFRWSGGNANWNAPLDWDQSVVPDVYAVSMRDYLIGDIDEFLDDGAADDVPVDPTWATDVGNSSALPLANLDDLSGNENITFTVQTVLDNEERVVHGSLALALRQSGGGLVNTDFVRLFDFDAEHRFDFSTLGWATQITPTETFVGVLDLGPFLDELQTGDINVQVNDDTGVDWALYTATVATPIADPLGPMVFLDGGGTVVVDTNVTPVAGLQLGGGVTTELAVDATGHVEIAGDYAQLIDGTLSIQLAGTAEGQFGTLTVDGTALLAGTLEVVLDGFAPMLDDTFRVIDSPAGIANQFDQTNLPNLGSGLAWDVSYVDGVVLTVVSATLAGDYNNDGTVNAADYVVWRDNVNLPVILPGDITPGTVDQSDYDVWRQNFAAGAGAASTAVPEPGAVAFMSMFLACMVSSTGRRRRR